MPNKATLAPRVEVSKNIRGSVLGIFIAIGIIISIANVVSIVRHHNSAPRPAPIATTSHVRPHVQPREIPKQEVQQKKPVIPLVKQPVSLWPIILLPPDGKSEKISIPTGMRPIFSGTQFRVHNVYSNGQECIQSASGKSIGSPCATDPVEVYLVNEINRRNSVSFVFVPNASKGKAQKKQKGAGRNVKKGE